MTPASFASAGRILLSFTAFGLAQTCLDYGWRLGLGPPGFGASRGAVGFGGGMGFLDHGVKPMGVWFGVLERVLGKPLVWIWI